MWEMWPLIKNAVEIASAQGDSDSKSAPHLDDAEAEVPPVEHDDLVLVGPLVQDVAQGQQRGGVGQHGAPPGRVALVRDHQVLLVVGDGLEKHCRLLVLVWGGEVVLRKKRASSGSSRR